VQESEVGMNVEKQIEFEMAEMLEVIEKAREIYANDITDHTENEYIREGLLDAGYRKQSEPISCGHEKGGEWVQLPCKVGDILYVITQMKDKRILPFINEYEVTSISINRKSIVVYHEMDGFIKNFRQCDFGKTIFLTREEAEQTVIDKNVGGK
jgi:hypothetical protein